MTSKEKVLKIYPKIIGFWDMKLYKVWLQNGNGTTSLLGCQSRESWAWAQALRNITK
jgi:hypothetical protein